MSAQGARNPNDLSRLLVERANAGDAAGIAALYTHDARMTVQGQSDLVGREAIRQFFDKLLAERPEFRLGEQRPALIAGNLALTSTRLADGTVTAEVAVRHPDGTWLWALDDPALAREAAP